MKGAYQYIIEASGNNVDWTTIADKRTNAIASAVMDDNFDVSTRYVRITITGLPRGMWASLFEFSLFDENNSSVNNLVNQSYTVRH